MQKTWSWSTTGYNFPNRSHEEIISLCAGAGLAGIEGVAELCAGRSEVELERLRRQYSDADLSIDTFHLPFAAEDDIACFYETTRRRAVDRMLQHLEQAALLGARAAIQHPSTSRFSVELEGLDRYLLQLDRSLQTLLPRAAEFGLILALENMLPGPEGPRLGSAPEHFALFAEKFGHPQLGFCLDTGHALIAGGPGGIRAFFQSMTPRLTALHLADNAGDRDSHLAPGRGLIDWSEFFQALSGIGFTYPACIETPPFAPGPNYQYSPQAWRQLVVEIEALVEKALNRTTA